MNKKRILKITLAVGIVVAVLIILGLVFRDTIVSFFFRPTDSSNVQAGNSIEDDPSAALSVAEYLDVPWSVAFLPDGDLLVTEREGTLRRVGNYEISLPIDSVVAQGEGGLLGLALDPQYQENNHIYLYMTTEADNRVLRYTFNGQELTDGTVVLEGIPKSSNHNGGRIAFGPDGHLYIGTGDAGNENLAQDRNSLAGKVLRITKDGGVPEDNPFNSAVYSIGHRNIQGLAWDGEGRLWSTEHGRSGAQTGYDELNRIEIGGNYGWPVIEGDETHEGMISPTLHSGPTTTWAPGSLAYAEGMLFFGGLRGQSLYQVKIDGDSVKDLIAHFQEDFGRIREVVINDRGLYFTTSNKDGRGSPAHADDRIFHVSSPSALSQE